MNKHLLVSEARREDEATSLVLSRLGLDDFCPALIDGV